MDTDRINQARQQEIVGNCAHSGEKSKGETGQLGNPNGYWTSLIAESTGRKVRWANTIDV